MIKRNQLSALALALGLVAGSASAQGSKVEMSSTPKPVKLQDVRANPAAYKNVFISFQAQFHSIGSVHNPFFTRFTRTEYTNFWAWGDEQKVWKLDEFSNPLSILFVKKLDNDALLAELFRFKRFDRLQVTGVVRNVFKNAPWIEVISIEKLGGKVTTPTLTHMHRAYAYMAKRRWTQAGTELNLAMTDGLPPFYQGWIHAYLGECLMKLGRPDPALNQLGYAQDYLPDERSVAKNIALVKSDPKRAIDQVEAGKSIPKNMVPIWVAVTGSSAGNRKKGQAARPGR